MRISDWSSDVCSSDLAVSMPDANRVREALAACPFVVVSDVIENTDTGAFAHVRLPAAAWGEKDGTVTNSDRTISRQRALFPLPGEAMPDWWIVKEVARRMGWKNRSEEHTSELQSLMRISYAVFCSKKTTT